jgi:hypothetical protein
MNCAFTICAKNYIGLAKILEQSIKDVNPEISFFIFVADEFDETVILSDNIIIARRALNIIDKTWERMAFQYNLTEFCTAIKPFCFQWIYDHSAAEKVIYFDPDIYIFNSLDYIYDSLDEYKIILTPHILTMQTEYSGDMEEKSFLNSGLFNLGFIALMRDLCVYKLLAWWQNRLFKQCFIDSLNYYFYDQKWMEFIPIFFSNNTYLSSKHLGLNLAPWNFFERKVFLRNDTLYVRNRIHDNDTKIYPLIFVHYSGYNYKELLARNNIEHKHGVYAEKYDDIASILNKYREILDNNKDVFNQFIKYTYSYNYYKNGALIAPYHRRLYFALVEKGEQWENPFSVDSIYKLFSKKGLIQRKTSQIGLNINRNNIPTKKLFIINIIFKCIYKFLGARNYFLLMNMLKYYSRTEVQIHLLDKKYSENNLY